MKIAMRALQLGLIVFLAIAATTFHCHAQSPIDSIAESHIEGNVPDAANFNAFLVRDLEAYFRALMKKPMKVTYELLRDGPTQTGIAYPKYYAWVRAIEGKKTIAEGAVRLAAVQKKYFEVTDFLSVGEMRRDSKAIFHVFPKAVGDKILLRLN